MPAGAARTAATVTAATASVPGNDPPAAPGIEQRRLAGDVFAFAIQAARRSVCILHRAEQLKAMPAILADIFIQWHFVHLVSRIFLWFNFTSH